MAPLTSGTYTIKLFGTGTYLASDGTDALNTWVKVESPSTPSINNVFNVQAVKGYEYRFTITAWDSRANVGQAMSGGNAWLSWVSEAQPWEITEGDGTYSIFLPSDSSGATSGWVNPESNPSYVELTANESENWVFSSFPIYG